MPMFPEILVPFPRDKILQLFRRCRPRLLVVTDGSLNFSETSGFGLWRFLHGITESSGVTLKPLLTLAHRGVSSTVTLGADTLTVIGGFEFHGANPAVTVANYDQVWLFGFSAAGLEPEEIQVMAEFMNDGGGVFATGDHGSIGRGLCGALPRVRHMREWSGIPMGFEAPATAVERIDTVVDPGSNELYEFDDQADDIPQRIYPNYAVTAGAAGWEARVHPVLRLAGAPDARLAADGNLGFTRDVDVLPDHPHESVCYEVTDPAVLNGSYTNAGLNFPEFQPSAAAPTTRLGAGIVAFGVSGGRSVTPFGAWKPPVRPRMFGIISAYDGRAAQPYSGKTARPGRILCDSTWHHYVNVNLDGRSTGRTGLGTWSGGFPGAGTFTPSPALEEIYAYYRNTITWLQPFSRIWCRIWWDLIVVRYHPALLEELLEAPRFTEWRHFVGLGTEAERLLRTESGALDFADALVDSFLSDQRTERLAALMEGPTVEALGDRRELARGAFGAILARLAEVLPADDPEAALRVLEQGPEKHAADLTDTAVRAFGLGVRQHVQRAQRTVRTFESNEVRRVIGEG